MDESGNIAVSVRSRRLLAVFLAVWVALCVCGCGGASTDAGQGSAAGSGGSDSVPAVATVGIPAEKISPDEVVSEEADETDEATATEAAEEPSDDSGDPSADERLIARFIDVGQGDCALITCGGQSLLVDGGPPKASSKVYTILKRLGFTRIDYVVATHPDADHIGGLSGALTVSTCGEFFCSTTTSDTKTFASLLTRVEGQGLSVQVPSPGDQVALGSATVTFIGPVSQGDSENNNSLVIRIDFGSTSFLLTGDAEKEEEQSLISSGANLKADVLKVAHHGSSSSSTAAFLSKVSPSYAVISVGENSYGHPTDATIGRLEATGAQILRTDDSGSVIMTSDGASISVSTTKGEIDE